MLNYPYLRFLSTLPSWILISFSWVFGNILLNRSSDLPVNLNFSVGESLPGFLRILFRKWDVTDYFDLCFPVTLGKEVIESAFSRSTLPSCDERVARFITGSIYVKLSSRILWSTVMASFEELFLSIIIILLSWCSTSLCRTSSSSLLSDFSWVSSLFATIVFSITYKD